MGSKSIHTLGRRTTVMFHSIGNRRTDGRTKGNTIPPLRNYVATGDNKLQKSLSQLAEPSQHFSFYTMTIDFSLHSLSKETNLWNLFSHGLVIHAWRLSAMHARGVPNLA